MENSKIQKIKNVLTYWMCMNTLKDVKRSGWLDWKVKRNRIESVQDHTASAQQLALIIYNEFQIDVNIDRVCSILAAHESEETIIGDLSLCGKLKEYQKEIGNIATETLFENMSGNYIQELISEFNERKTPEAKFARFIDKLECDLQSKVYGEEKTVDLNNQEDNISYYNKLVQELLNSGKSFEEMWMEFGRKVYNYPEVINEISTYAQNNNLHDIGDSKINEGKARVREYVEKNKLDE